MDYALLKNKRSWNNSGSGIAAHALIAPMSWFVANTGLKSPVAPFLKAGDGITVKLKHDFKEGKGFLYFSLAPRKNQLDAGVIGDFGFVKYNQEATIMIPGSDPAIHETVQSLMNEPLIVLLKDSSCKAGMYYQLGSECEGSFLSAPFATGTTGEGVKGFNCKVAYDGAVQFYMVDGGPEIMADEV